jgi:Tol biopolymer transport system component
MSKAAGIVALLAALALVAPARAARDDLVLASRVSGASGAAANANSVPTSISADGRFVAFSSFATNLSDETTGGHEAVFVRDLEAHTTTLASRASGAGGEGADDYSLGASIPADGRLVAFESRADNLSADDADETIDVFVRDLRTATTTLVSRVSGMGAGGDDHSGGPRISGDGRRVAFLSYADNLSSADDDSVPNIFVRDLESNVTVLVSRATDGAPADGGSGGNLSISADGRFVAFSSSADNLSAEDDDGVWDVFVRDLTTNTTTYVSRAGTPGDGDSASPSISADGRVVAFHSDADSLGTQDENSVTNVFVRDLQAGTTTYVTRASGAGGEAADSDSFAPTLSADGRCVLFSSRANNLSREDIDEFVNVFVRELETNALAYVSRGAGAAGVAADGTSLGSGISGDGRYAVFASNAQNLSNDDGDATIDVFVRDVLGAPATPATAPVAQPTLDTTGPALAARALAQGNRAVRVSRRGRLRLFCGRFAEPVTGSCGARGLGTRAFTAPAGKRVKVSLRLSRRSLRRLNDVRRVRMRGTITARDTVGNATTVRFRFTLMAAAR